MKILALNPPFLPKYSREMRSPAVTKSGTLYYPMWLAYAVGYLEKHGHEVLFIDAPASGVTLEDVVSRARVYKPAMLMVATSTPSIYNDAKVAEALKNAVDGLFSVGVGVHVSALPEQTLKEAPRAFDSLALREFDETVVELANLLEKEGRSDETLAKVKGLAYTSASGAFVRNIDRPYMENLDDLPFVSAVYKKHLSIDPYFYGHSKHPIMVIVTGRGCPFHCTYCVVPQTLQGHRYRKRSVENLVAEFRYINENFPEVREIMIEDDTLTADRARCQEFSKMLVEQKLTRIPWSANSRADVDYETMRVMRKANCRLFCVGFESGEQTILDNIKKSMTLEKIREFRKGARKAGIMVHGCFMVGNKGETHATLKKTLKLALDLAPDTAQFYPIMAYPGTEAYDYFQSQGWITTKNFRDWLTPDGLHSSVVNNPDLTYAELCAFCDHCRRRFYLRPRYFGMKLMQSLRDPEEGKRNIMGFLSLIKFLFRRGR